MGSLEVPSILDHVAFLGPLNEFGYLLTKLCEQQGKTVNKIARAAGFRGNSRIYYAIRSKAAPGKSATLTEDELLRLSKVLNLSVEAADHFVLAAHLEAAPPRLRRYVRRLEARKLPHED